jgi:hypothetical protein
MFIPVFSRRYQAEVTDAETRRVVCERCRTEYQYQVVRKAKGDGTSLYLLDNEGAERRAEERAERALNRKMRTAIEPHPCPECHWMQSEMVHELRRRSYPVLFWTFGVVIPILLGVVLWFVVQVGTEYFSSSLEAPALRLALALVAGLGVSLLIGQGLRYLLTRRIDPNATWQGIPSHMILASARTAESPERVLSRLQYAVKGVPHAKAEPNPWLWPAFLFGAGVLCWCIMPVITAYESSMSHNMYQGIELVVKGGGSLLLLGGLVMVKHAAE